MPRAKKNKYPPAGPVRECEGFSIKIRHQMQPKNYAQEMYIDSLRETPFTICSGPAGCGKTWLVTYAALEKLLAGQVERIIITRPVVEAGENLGFLPGTLEEKLDPYLIPIVDAIKDHIGPLATKSLMESGKIEIAPLAFMRGRSFRNCFVVLDEAQNSTVDQMRMFVTRMGNHSYFCVNGDISQSDLEKPRNFVGQWENGLEYIIRKLAGRDAKINYIEFHNRDVIRSEMVKKILILLDAPDERPHSVDMHNSNGARAHLSS